MNGRVTSFDEAAGLGEVTGEDGTRFVFHCVEIADGTRLIDSDTRIEFEMLAKLGTYEAGCLRKR